MVAKKTERLGEISYNNWGSKIEIIRYKSANDMTVQFENGYITDCQYGHLKRGLVMSPYDKGVCGVGFHGEGKYKAWISRYKITNQYQTWTSMIRRCYDVKCQEKYRSYIGCTVAPEWHNFQIFAEWYDENIYKVGDERIDIDKDILIKGNRIYSPETCIFAPQKINSLIVNKASARGLYPVGVTWSKKMQKFSAACSNTNKQVYLGYHTTPEEAFHVYKDYKENLIKMVAELYKDYIPTKLYDSLNQYSIEITD